MGGGGGDVIFTSPGIKRSWKKISITMTISHVIMNLLSGKNTILFLSFS